MLDDFIDVFPSTANEWDNFLLYVCSTTWLFSAFQGFRWIWHKSGNIIGKAVSRIIEKRLDELDVIGEYKRIEEENAKIGKKEAIFRKTDVKYFCEYTVSQLKSYWEYEMEDDKNQTEKDDYSTHRLTVKEVAKKYTDVTFYVTCLVAIELMTRNSNYLGFGNLYVFFPYFYLLYKWVEIVFYLRGVVAKEYIRDLNTFKGLWNMYCKKMLDNAEAASRALFHPAFLMNTEEKNKSVIILVNGRSHDERDSWT